ncbi:MAG: prepilin-type N-terminal cleavage/methylation domain-containing protein [Minisyncoccia bacterium]
MKRDGFSLVELIVVMAVGGLLTAGATVSFGALRNSTNLEAAADLVKTTLEKSRLSALAREDGSGWSVKINSNNLVWFKGTAYDSGDANNKPIGLPDGVQIASVNLENSASSVFFNTLTGTTSPGNVVISLISDPAKTRTVYINRSGTVARSSATDIAKPITDHRHLHFDLGWSIQGALELKFIFSGPSQTQTVVMAPYFNADSSSFDYTGAFTVGGATQKIRVHTHSLTASNTLLSIGHSMMENSKAVEILIDNKSITAYTAAGVATAGAFGGTMTPQ